MINFSLIVPVYNVEKYLRRCLDSISAQNYANYEVICVNDGSTDSSGEILKEYKGRIARFKIVNQDNTGLGGARNAGINLAKGDYVWFIDSDDWIAPDALMKISNCIDKEKDVGVVMVDLIRIYENGKKEIRSVRGGFSENEPLSCANFTKHLLLYDGIYAAQSKIFRRDVLGDFRFSKGFYEDIPLITLFGKSDYHISHLEGEIYYYFQRSGSIMKTIDNRILDIFKQYDIVYDYLKDDSRYKYLLAHFLYYLSTIT